VAGLAYHAGNGSGLKVERRRAIAYSFLDPLKDLRADRLLLQMFECLAVSASRSTVARDGTYRVNPDHCFSNNGTRRHSKRRSTPKEMRTVYAQ